ncbi:hypothetical protein KY290_001196 [Solanum tuberosum]|uniref:HECT-type E3 ubiquitin transferase n=1 Tax=Solanum tuberosum TaxID=4113 RepID=A0ABQ7WLI6_SOLTU|nr:hypothetical protein KY290_001196 [Solanum tuberosum]
MSMLALAYDVQIIGFFYCVYFLKLVGQGVLLEDIKDKDLFLYRSCNEILNMDAEIEDQHVLGLTFVCEIESLGSRRQIELCPNGKDIVVDRFSDVWSRFGAFYYILIKMTKEDKHLKPNLLDIDLYDKQEEAMLMSNMDLSPVTDQRGNDRDNDSEVYESIRFSG